MKRHPAVAVTVAVEIWDGNAVIRAARAAMRQSGTRYGRSLTAKEAVQWLVDPGDLPGCTVLESSRE